MTRKTYTLIGLLVLLIVLIVLGWKYNILPKNSGQNNTNNEQKNPGDAVKKEGLVQGKLVAGFPQELILNSNGTIVESYKVTYPTADQLTTVFNTSKTVAVELEAYQSAFTKGGYKTLNKTSTKNLATIYGTKNTVEVNVSITQNTGDKVATVSVTYLSKK